MSGIYIPDISLPGDGDFELWIAVRKDGSFTYNVRGGWNDGKHKVISVPDHGRVVEADALLATGRETFEDYHISEAPTIIPASEEAEE